MAIVECKLGPCDPYVAGFQLSFVRDKHGRFVADVTDPRALSCLLSVEHYQLADEDLDLDPPDKAADAGSAQTDGAAAEKPKRGRPKKTDQAPGLAPAAPQPVASADDSAAAGQETEATALTDGAAA